MMNILITHANKEKVFHITSNKVINHIINICNSDDSFENMCMNGIPVVNDNNALLMAELNAIKYQISQPSSELMTLNTKLDEVKTSLSIKSSQKIGEIGEKTFSERLTYELNKPWKDMSKTAHAGDFHVTLPNGVDVLFDIKSYTNPVPSHEITKTLNDIRRLKNIKFGVIYSLRSSISGKKGFEMIDYGDCSILCVQEKSPEYLHICIDILSAYSKLIKHNEQVDISLYIEEINTLTERFSKQKNIICEMKSSFDKNISCLLNNVREYEFEMGLIMSKLNDIIEPRVYNKDTISTIDEIHGCIDKDAFPRFMELTLICKTLFEHSLYITKPVEKSKYQYIFIKQDDNIVGDIEIYKSKILINTNCAKFDINNKTNWDNIKQCVISLMISL